MSTVIEISGLTKKYGNNKAVDNISFTVDSGEILGFLGPNGAGKSTTMNILTGYLSKTLGTVKVCGFDILENPKEVKKRIGYLPEQPPIYMEMTPFEYLDFVCDLNFVKENKKEHIEDVMEKVGLTNMQARLIKNLSKGYKQRVGLAGALIGDPEVLVLDEPTVGLDPRQIIEIRNVIKELSKEKTIILSTHILQEVAAVCDRVIIINHGQIVAEDTLENLSGNDKVKTYLLRVKGDRNTINEIVKNAEFIGEHTIFSEKEPNAFDISITSLNPQDDIREEIFNLFAKENMVILSFKKKEISLEEVFVNATNQVPQYEIEEEDAPKEKFFQKWFSKKSNMQDDLQLSENDELQEEDIEEEIENIEEETQEVQNDEKEEN